jgi:programmed cell death 8 (apoptosis-inducing factor)
LLPQTDVSNRLKVTLFRRLDDYFRLADIAKKSESIAIIGGGFLGSELACAMSAWSPQPKLEVIQIFPENGNMSKVT